MTGVRRNYRIVVDFVGTLDAALNIYGEIIWLPDSRYGLRARTALYRRDREIVTNDVIMKESLIKAETVPMFGRGK